ncbi:MAG: TraB/GumN family protein [Gammaproteobacteria bacterium]|nr:TraB/GumN family protein [Gammaproteobacteria bacterium]
MIRNTLAVVILALMAAASCARTLSERHILWQVDGEDNTVYLLGSVHLLRQEDYPLPEIYNIVYADAETLVMELDMDDLDPLQLQQHMMTSGLIADGGSLRKIMGDTMWAKAKKSADQLDIKLEMLDATEPWLAALTIVELEMMKLGFDAALGVEFHFLDRARTDDKPVRGLETAEQQIAVFDELPLDTQSRFLLKTLDDAQTIEVGLDALITAWRSGNIEAMQDELIKGFDGFPQVYDTLVVQRNQAWTHDIVALLNDKDDYLIIVGALHLIGADSVLEQLRKKGYSVNQL